MSGAARSLRFPAGDRAGEVSALLLRPARARALLALAHGAGADMHHAFMEAVSVRLADLELASFRYQFPYAEAGRRSPNPKAVLVACVRAAVAEATRVAGDLPLLAGGKSMGGRMTSLAAAEEPLPGVRGLIFLGFPLHAAGRPGSDRADHLSTLRVPMLFLQGTRDRLADLERMRRLDSKLGDRSTLHVVEGGDHSFHVPKRSGRSDGDVLDEITHRVARWAEEVP